MVTPQVDTALIGMKLAAAQQKEAITVSLRAAAALPAPRMAADQRCRPPSQLSGASVSAIMDRSKAFKESGFKPKMVYRNLPPSHLYEKVRAACTCRQPPERPADARTMRNRLVMRTRRVLMRQRAPRSPAAAPQTRRRCRRPPAHQLLPGRPDPRTQALRYEPGTHIVKSGALSTTSGAPPARSAPRPCRHAPPHAPQALLPSHAPPRRPLTRCCCLPRPAGAKTGRCPRDKRVVREPSTEKDIWWASSSSGSPNFEMDER